MLILQGCMNTYYEIQKYVKTLYMYALWQTWNRVSLWRHPYCGPLILILEPIVLAYYFYWCSCIPLRFRMWQFNRLGPDNPSYWKGVYDLHVISSKCCHHLSLFTQLSDPVTFTDKHCPGKHSTNTTQIPQRRLWHIYTSSHTLLFFWSVFISALLWM